MCFSTIINFVRDIATCYAAASPRPTVANQRTSQAPFPPPQLLLHKRKRLPVPCAPSATEYYMRLFAPPEWETLSYATILNRVACAEIRDELLQGLKDLEFNSSSPSSYALRMPRMRPTHIITIGSSSNPSSKPLSFACHGILLAAHFPNLPLSAIPPESPHLAYRLHTFELSLPFPQYFVVLREWMYTHSKDELRASLLPSEHILQMLDVKELMERAGTVWAVYKNACVLGLRGPDCEVFWECVQAAWKEVLGILKTATCDYNL